MKLSIRLFLGLSLLAAAALWLSFQNFRQELIPGMRRSLEEVLVDTANLLAVMVQPEVAGGSATGGMFEQQMQAFDQRQLNALIYETHKADTSMIVYITDDKGIVIFDSRGRDLGRDYSHWNDVFLTLRGEYGARSTREDPDDDRSSVMYVAAPIMDNDRIIGVLTVGKPSHVVMPFVVTAQQSLLIKGAWLFVLSLLVAILLTLALTRSIRRVSRYAEEVTVDRRAKPPDVGERELVRLADAIASMRTALDGKDYVEQYLYALTHELKSPLAAIEGAAELLEENPPDEARNRFVGNIRRESGRLREVVERLMQLSALESRGRLETIQSCDPAELVKQVADERIERAATGRRHHANRAGGRCPGRGGAVPVAPGDRKSTGQRRRLLALRKHTPDLGHAHGRIVGAECSGFGAGLPGLCRRATVRTFLLAPPPRRTPQEHGAGTGRSSRDR